jgi:hypothetical protein
MTDALFARDKGFTYNACKLSGVPVSVRVQE